MTLNETHPYRMSSFPAAPILATAAMALAQATSACAGLAGLYLVKSAMGINLLPGPSPLHDLLYHFVR